MRLRSSETIVTAGRSAIVGGPAILRQIETHAVDMGL